MSTLEHSSPHADEDPTAGQNEVAVDGQRLTLYCESPPLVEAMLADIASARERVWLETYIFSADPAGDAISTALIERAQAGLDVRVMADAVGSYSTPGTFWQRLRDGGVQVHLYHTLSYALRQLALFSIFNRRNHRKILVVDEHTAFFGGMNIVDQSQVHDVDASKKRKLPKSAGWRDVHVRMSGPKVAELADAFLRLWQRVHHRAPESWPRWQVRRMTRTTADSIWFFDCRPTVRYHQAHRALVPLLRHAQKSITVSMAYFIPVGRVLRELTRARRRGVEVRVIIPAESDVPVVQWATRHFYHYLLKRGIRIFERNHTMLHSKVLIVDDQWTSVGSCNLDPRSLRLNLELIGVIRSREFACAVQHICDYELKHSRAVTIDDVHRRTWRQKLLDRLAWSMRRWL